MLLKDLLEVLNSNDIMELCDEVGLHITTERVCSFKNYVYAHYYYNCEVVKISLKMYESVVGKAPQYEILVK